MKMIYILKKLNFFKKRGGLKGTLCLYIINNFIVTPLPFYNLNDLKSYILIIFYEDVNK